jgi:hypothetical protein
MRMIYCKSASVLKYYIKQNMEKNTIQYNTIQYNTTYKNMDTQEEERERQQ